MRYRPRERTDDPRGTVARAPTRTITVADLLIDILHPMLLKANDLVLLAHENGEVPLDVPGFGLFSRDTRTIPQAFSWSISFWELLWLIGSEMPVRTTSLE
jgi:hypothetical protein